ncbi:hypothetical protein HDV00_008140 [Rhizophlyctis rosea]|nr:hypothetical protein HDV00_008140 [Rhizophlyctis rosea]
MTTRSRKQPDALAEHEQELLEYMNNKKQDLVLMAEYYAKAKFAYQCKATEIDRTGFTIQYMDKNMEGELQQKDVRVQFQTPATNKETAKERIIATTKEARQALGLEIDRTYVPPGRKGPKLFVWPNSTMMQVIIFFWILCAVLAYVPKLPLRVELWRFNAGGPEQFQWLLFSAVIMHLVESVAIIGMGIYTKFPPRILLKWWLLSIPFGIAALGPFVKTAAKRKFAEDAKSKEVKIN